jgi:catechol 2,3-dioxygenase-like lactoylglutathione lyase family enzyme
MQQRLELVTLGVRDLAASRQFYIEGLGWEPNLDLDEIVFFQVGHGLLLALFSAAELEADVYPGVAQASRDALPEPVRFTLAHTVETEADVDKALERAVAAGGTILKNAQPAAFGGYHGYVADPDGFRWEIAYNPGVTVAPDGRVSIVPIGP